MQLASSPLIGLFGLLGAILTWPPSEGHPLYVMAKNRTFCVDIKLIFLSAYLNSTENPTPFSCITHENRTSGCLRQENGKFWPWGAKLKMAAT